MDEQRGIKSVRHVRAVYPLTGARVHSTCAATGLIGGWVWEKQRSSLTVHVQRRFCASNRRPVLRKAAKRPPRFVCFLLTTGPSWLCER